MTSEDVLAAAPPPVSVEHAATVADELYGVSGRVIPLTGDPARDFAVHGGDKSWMLNIAHPAERPDVLAIQQEVLDHVRLWDPDLPVPRPVPTLSGELVGSTVVDGTALPVRLTSFIAGVTAEETGWTTQLRRDSARILARLGLALRSF